MFDEMHVVNEDDPRFSHVARGVEEDPYALGLLLVQHVPRKMKLLGVKGDGSARETSLSFGGLTDGALGFLGVRGSAYRLGGVEDVDIKLKFTMTKDFGELSSGVG